MDRDGDDELIQRGLEAYEHFTAPLAACESLDAIEAFCTSDHAKLDFSDCDVLFVQHLLGPTLARLNAMWSHGLTTDRTWFVDIPYSTHAPLRQLLVERKVPPEQVALPFDNPLVSYATAQKMRVGEILRRMVEKGLARRVLVVDDGAYFVRTMHLMRSVSPPVFAAFAGRTAIVEQTTRGHRHLHQGRYQTTLRALGASPVSIAKCDTKRGFEGPFIGQAVARRIQELIGARGTPPGRVALLGFGTVGHATFDRLRRHLPEPMDVVEPDASKHPEIARAGGRPCPTFPDAGAYDVVIGCTGHGAFEWEARSRLGPDAALISGSSGAVEFNRELFIERAARDPNDAIEVLEPETTIRQGIHATIRFRDGERLFSFLHAGFPANFDGRLECLPVDVIQATHVLLLAASMQALRPEGSGVREIDPELDAWTLATSRDCLECALER